MDNTQQQPRLKALEIARSYIGKEEVPRGSNWGPFVQSCLATVGINFAASWCQAFVNKCFLDALGAANPVYKTGGVLKCWQNSKNRILKVNATTQNILPGYQFIYEHGKGLGHTGFVEAVHADSTFTTIEGNTDPAGSRNGYGVFRRTRSLHDIQLVGFIVY